MFECIWNDCPHSIFQFSINVVLNSVYLCLQVAITGTVMNDGEEHSGAGGVM